MAVTLRQQFSSVCLKCVRRLIVKQLTPQSYVTSRWFGVQHRSKNFVSICHKTTSKQVRQYSDETDHSSLIDVDYDEVVSGLQDNSIIFIDIREPQELEMMGKYHPAAIHIPMGELGAALEMSPDKFKSLYGSEQPESEDDIVFGCYSGIRSLTALILARQLGFEKAKHYPGGYREWVEKMKHDEDG